MKGSFAFQEQFFSICVYICRVKYRALFPYRSCFVFSLNQQGKTLLDSIFNVLTARVELPSAGTGGAVAEVGEWKPVSLSTLK